MTKEYEKVEKLEHINDWYDNEEYFFHKYIPKEESSIREIAHGVFTTIKDMPKDDATYGLIHGDLWLGNTLVDKDTKITMIDFQDCEKHFYIFDLAVPIFSALEYSFVGTGNILDYARAITEAIIEGYKEENELSSDMLKLLPHFVKLKEIFDYNTMHMYWDKENLTEEQIRIMNHFRMRIERNLSFLP